jgi:type III secretory pathway component EscS
MFRKIDWLHWLLWSLGVMISSLFVMLIISFIQAVAGCK